MSVFEKCGIVFSVFTLIVLCLLMIFGQNGLVDYQKLKQKERDILLETQRIEVENREIAKEINQLKNDLEYIEHVAKHEHEMASPDELIFKIKPNATDKKGDK